MFIVFYYAGIESVNTWKAS